MQAKNLYEQAKQTAASAGQKVSDIAEAAQKSVSNTVRDSHAERCARALARSFPLGFRHPTCTVECIVGRSTAESEIF